VVKYAMVEKEQASILVQVQPNAARSEVLRFKDGVLHIRIAAPPIEGKANQELMKLLGKILGVGKSSLSIKKGITSRRKVITVGGLTQGQLLERLGLGDSHSE
jgi:uncharacterized protein (TIGR00251 family)